MTPYIPIEDIPVVEEKAVGRRLSRKVKSLKRKSAYSANVSPIALTSCHHVISCIRRVQIVLMYPQ